MPRPFFHHSISIQMATVSESNDKFTVVFSDNTTITLKKPNRAILGQMLAATRRDPLAAADVIISQLMLDGDKSIKDDTGYCYQLIKLTDELFGKQDCIIEWKDNKAVVLFADDKSCTLRQPKRSEYSAAQAASRVNPLRYIEDLLRACWLEGDEDIRTSASHLLGLAEVMDEFVSYVGEKLKN